MIPKIHVLCGDGLNCEKETLWCLEKVGASGELLHINDLAPYKLNGQGIVIPGGFSFGDELGSGRLFSLKLKHFLGESLDLWVDKGKLLLGICNGFQVLTHLGVFFDESQERRILLDENVQGDFIDQWVDLEACGSRGLWFEGSSSWSLPIRHKEGRFMAKEEDILNLQKNGQVALTYKNNINGSMGNIAGITNTKGNVLGLMPHPEAAWDYKLFPKTAGPLGISLFENMLRMI